MSRYHQRQRSEAWPRRKRPPGADPIQPQQAAVRAYRLLEPGAQVVRPGSLPARSLQIAAVTDLQRLSGNAAVQRYLADTGGGVVQRQKARGEAEAAREGGEKAAGFDLDRSLSGQIYDLVKGQLGEAKLKEHGKSLAKKASELLLAQIKEADSEADFVRQAQHKVMGDLFAAEVSKAVAEILNSPAGKRAREIILQQARQEPASVIGLALSALAAMAVSNADIPEVDIESKLGKGFAVAGKASLGKFQALALKQVKLGIAYSARAFQASLSGAYTGEAPKTKLTMAEEAGLTAEEKQCLSASERRSRNLRRGVAPPGQR